MFLDPTSASRETVLAAVFAALERVPGVELIERNRQHEVDENVSSALLMFDGDILGETDRPDAALERHVTFPLSYVIEIQGFIQGGEGNPGTLINGLYRRMIQALWADSDLRAFLRANGIGLKLAGGSFPDLRSKGAAKVGLFIVLIELPFEFDPLDP